MDISRSTDARRRPSALAGAGLVVLLLAAGGSLATGDPPHASTPSTRTCDAEHVAI